MKKSWHTTIWLFVHKIYCIIVLEIDVVQICNIGLVVALQNNPFFHINRGRSIFFSVATILLNWAETGPAQLPAWALGLLDMGLSIASRRMPIRRSRALVSGIKAAQRRRFEKNPSPIDLSRNGASPSSLLAMVCPPPPASSRPLADTACGFG